MFTNKYALKFSVFDQKFKNNKWINNQKNLKL